ncbi:MAG: methylenetetrahydrofolate reductase [Cardiobacteriaceae bacterium]|nr:methylenetetrahydrofolate reductase [Cardiobacteriaceae bacterium]
MFHHQEDEKTIKQISEFMNRVSVEVTPKSFAKLPQALNEYLMPETSVYITHLQGSFLADTAGAAAKILEQGFRPICHIGARNLRSETELDEGLAQMNAAGVRDILLLAGGGDGKTSPYQDSLAVLESGKLEKYQLRSVGFAGHPEGNPATTLEKTRDSLRIKAEYAKSNPRDYYLITQFCFTAEPVLNWWRQTREQIPFWNSLHIGIPGVTNSASLLRHATNCGVGASISFLKNNGGFLRRFFMNDITAPGKLIRDLAAARLNSALEGDVSLHFFPLGAFTRTTAWMRSVQSNHYKLHRKKGIVVHTPN